MRHCRVIMAMVFILLTASVFSFAAASVASPGENDIIYSDSFLVSVKLTDFERVRITVFEEKDSRVVVQEKEGGAEKEILYFPVDVSKFTKEDIALISAGKTEGEDGKPIFLSTGDPVKAYKAFPIGEPVIVSKNSDAGVYTKTFEEVKPGLYGIKVETLSPEKKGSEDKVISETAVRFAVLEEQAEDDKNKQNDLLSQNQNGVVKAIQNFLKSLFK